MAPAPLHRVLLLCQFLALGLAYLASPYARDVELIERVPAKFATGHLERQTRGPVAGGKDKYTTEYFEEQMAGRSMAGTSVFYTSPTWATTEQRREIERAATGFASGNQLFTLRTLLRPSTPVPDDDAPVEDRTLFWENASRAMARRAGGVTYVVTADPLQLASHTTGIWHRIEWPLLLERWRAGSNGAPTVLIAVDAADARNQYVLDWQTLTYDRETTSRLLRIDWASVQVPAEVKEPLAEGRPSLEQCLRAIPAIGARYRLSTNALSEALKEKRAEQRGTGSIGALNVNKCRQLLDLIEVSDRPDAPPKPRSRWEWTNQTRDRLCPYVDQLRVHIGLAADSGAGTYDTLALALYDLRTGREHMQELVAGPGAGYAAWADVDIRRAFQTGKLKLGRLGRVRIFDKRTSALGADRWKLQA
ncbi:hypothetical protein CDD83_3033 [Cordyceps sp. RAO-2017]|nr:hypothetical protein CDD83_3033 [Cordyceps sp. RAO-2017]